MVLNDDVAFSTNGGEPQSWAVLHHVCVMHATREMKQTDVLILYTNQESIELSVFCTVLYYLTL